MWNMASMRAPRSVAPIIAVIAAFLGGLTDLEHRRRLLPSRLLPVPASRARAEEIRVCRGRTLWPLARPVVTHLCAVKRVRAGDRGKPRDVASGSPGMTDPTNNGR